MNPSECLFSLIGSGLPLRFRKASFGKLSEIICMISFNWIAKKPWYDRVSSRSSGKAFIPFISSRTSTGSLIYNFDSFKHCNEFED